jgi:hypothetical protein
MAELLVLLVVVSPPPLSHAPPLTGALLFLDTITVPIVYNLNQPTNTSCRFVLLS